MSDPNTPPGQPQQPVGYAQDPAAPNTNQPYPPRPIPPMQPMQGHATASRGNGLAVAGMVCGICGLALFFIPIFAWIVAIVGIVLGAIGMSKANRLPMRKGHGMGLAGVVCGAVGLVVGIVYFVVLVHVVKNEKSRIERRFGSHEVTSPQSAEPPPSPTQRS